MNQKELEAKLLRLKEFRDNQKFIKDVFSGYFTSPLSFRGDNLQFLSLAVPQVGNLNLEDTTFAGANLRRINLQGTNFTGANLAGADLTGAIFYRTIGNSREIKSLFIENSYPVSYTFDKLTIGCATHPIVDWWNFTNKDIRELDGRHFWHFSVFGMWKKWKPILKQIIEASPAIATGHEK